MKERIISNIALLCNTLIFLVLGIILISVPTKSIHFFHVTVTTSIIIIGIISSILNIIHKKNLQNTTISILMTFIGFFFLNNAESFLAIFPIIFGTYIFLSGLIKLATFIIYKINGFKGFYRIFFNFILDLVFSLIVIFNPLKSIKTLTYILGIYFISISINYFIDYLEERHFKIGKRRLRITMPKILSIFIPYAFYTRINKILSKELTNVKINKDVSGKVDLEIFIAVKDSNIGKFGHADLCFNNKVYSYGHYDEDSKKLFDTIGDGVLFTVNNKKKYLRFCAEHSKKTIFVFGITLTDKQKMRVQKELEKIESYTYRWKCVQELDNSKEYDDYASCLYRATKAKFYKFNESSYRIYFAPWTNCVKLVDNVLGVVGSDIIHLNGFITPGAYYYYLNSEFKKKNSNVIKKEIFTNEDLFEKNRPLKK